MHLKNIRHVNTNACKQLLSNLMFSKAFHSTQTTCILNVSFQFAHVANLRQTKRSTRVYTGFKQSANSTCSVGQTCKNQGFATDSTNLLTRKLKFSPRGRERIVDSACLHNSDIYLNTIHVKTCYENLVCSCDFLLL